MREGAALYLHQDRYEDAESLLTRLLAIRRRILGDQHPDMVWTMKKLALRALETGQERRGDRVDGASYRHEDRLWAAIARIHYHRENVL